MRLTRLYIPLLLIAAAAASQTETATGVIHGTVIGQDSEPAAAIRLTAESVSGLGPAAIFIHTVTDSAGKFAFEHVLFGPYVLYADDWGHGYSSFSTGPNSSGSSWKAPRVEVNATNPQTEVNWQLPPSAGLLFVDLRDARTGAVIPEMQLTITEADAQRTFLGRLESDSSRSLLFPSDHDLLVHVSANGYREWQQSSGIGKAIRAAPGERMHIEVRLEPIE